jgi:hypothetical protein
MKIPPSLKDKLQALNTSMMDQLKSHFPKADIRPWMLDDQDWIRFSMTRLDQDDTPQSGDWSIWRWKNLESKPLALWVVAAFKTALIEENSVRVLCLSFMLCTRMTMLWVLHLVY